MSKAAATACCEGQDWCAVTCTSELLARKWHTIIVHELLERQAAGFAELEAAIEGISAKVLTESLEDLAANGLVEREVVQAEPERVCYELTEPGRDLRPVIEAMEAWGTEHLAPGQPVEGPS